ncbi:MAG: ester cyclase [Sphingomonas parapaucimobilis]
MHSGDDLGIPATGKPVDFQVMDLFHIKDGKLTEHWALMDNLGMLQQIGAV